MIFLFLLLFWWFMLLLLLLLLLLLSSSLTSLLLSSLLKSPILPPWTSVITHVLCGRSECCWKNGQLKSVYAWLEFETTSSSQSCDSLLLINVPILIHSWEVAKHQPLLSLWWHLLLFLIDIYFFCYSFYYYLLLLFHCYLLSFAKTML